MEEGTAGGSLGTALLMAGLPPPGDLGLPSSWEDCDLQVVSRERLPGSRGSLAATLALGSVAFSRGFSSERVFPAALQEPPPAFLASRVVLPRSADRRVSFWRRADLKKDKPFSSDLLSLFRLDRDPVLGERRLAREVLRTCLPSGALPSPRTWPSRGEFVRGLAAPPVFSEPMLSLEPSLLRPRSEVLLLPEGGCPRTEPPELLLAAAEEDGEETGRCFCWVEVAEAASGPFMPASFLPGLAAGEPGRPLALHESSLLRERGAFGKALEGGGEVTDR